MPLCRCPQRPKEDTESPGVGITSRCELVWVLGTQLWAAAGAADTLE